MRYFKNSELVKLYDISDKAVRNWIESAKQQKNSLELYNHQGKSYIADTIHNSGILDKLTEDGRNYRNKRSHRAIAPLEQFYELYTDREIIDIINNLEKYQEIPCHYRYRDKGAHYWDSYLSKLDSTDRTNMLNATIKLLDDESDFLARKVKSYKRVNVIDIGVGNGLAAKSLLKQIPSSKLKHYIGVDNSPELLEITAANVKSWTSSHTEIIKCRRDINFERFEDVITLNTPPDTLNIVLFLGGTIGNFRDPSQALKTIRESMGFNDILITTDKLDSYNARRFFDFNTADDISELALYNRFILNLLSIDSSMYTTEQFFDEKEHARRIQVRLKVSLTIQFKIGGHTRAVELEKGSSVLLLRMWEWSGEKLARIYEKCGFMQIRTVLSEDQEYLLLVSKTGKKVTLPFI